MLHPGLTHTEADLRIREDLRAAEARSAHPRRPRPPSRVRAVVASRLVRLAARVADEPVAVVARRAA
ncbi:hypothetical protein [Egicoccus halophilus]|uniref:Uncharacterized protein n=1 Tax=Egicoccus halophilus TaxID=1670830 RepID=A0A8J3A9Q0_9ACTN|nr:hypothetical protein [Egicoccus halophilus]GGI08278.1 hypothetical protein GCM10011354_28290 [Egicoccus halophilus]